MTSENSRLVMPELLTSQRLQDRSEGLLVFSCSAYLLLRRRGELDGRRTSDGHDGARQGDVGQPPLPDPAAVVGDLERTAFVVVQTTTWRGEHNFRCRGVSFYIPNSV